MNTLEGKLHRTGVQLLVEAGHRELAAAARDAVVTTLVSGFDAYGLSIDLPPSSFSLVRGNPAYRETLAKTRGMVAAGLVTDQNGNEVTDPAVEFRVKLLDVAKGGQAVVRDLIVNHKDASQALVSGTVFWRAGRTLYQYNETKFASQSEIRVAQVLKNRRVLFFPLALAVRADTGSSYQDHREVDFLVCQDGTWGVLECPTTPTGSRRTPSRTVGWSGRACCASSTTRPSGCYQHPGEVVSEFLDILASHRR